MKRSKGFKDITGKIFGRWVVINFSYIDKHRMAHWVCKCTCGNIKVVTGQSLRKGTSQSCGCLKDEISRERFFKDIKNQTFNRWAVIEYSHIDKHGQAIWLCKCECGTMRKVSGQSLRKGDSQSCGCLCAEHVHDAIFRDLTGQRFGRLIVKEVKETNLRGDTVWICLCDCGSVTNVFRTSLISGNTKSCGCLNKEIVSKMMTTHGLSNSRLHSIWTNMKQRCLNPNNTGFFKYGGRNISLCDRWLVFENFYEDLHLSYEQHITEFGELNTSLDRYPDNDGNYELNNVRWATNSEQGRNTRVSAKSEDIIAHNRNKNKIMSRIRACLIRGTKKSYVFPKYTGCSVEEFRRHIESLWLPGMTWENVGVSKIGIKVWQLDHIIGCNNFDLSKEEDLKKCFYYTNFQPKWWEDHAKKNKFVISKEN